MKKIVLLIGLLLVAGIPLMAAEVGGSLDLNYVMYTPEDTTDTESSESYFAMVTTKLTASAELGENLIGFVKLNLVEDPFGNGHSAGIHSPGMIATEELWVSKTDAFAQAGLGFKFGKMEVPGNLDFDTGTTHTLTNNFEIDFAWGLTASYAAEGIGTFSLTSFEGLGGTDATTGPPPDDEDTGLFTSMVLQWDTGEDAFDVAGLRLVVAYGMIAADDDADDGNVISIGGTYTLADVGLKVGLEIDMVTDINTSSAYLPAVYGEGAMLIAINGDYDVNEEVCVGLSYEMYSVNEDTDAGLIDNTTSRMALRGSYKIADNTKLRLEYASVTNDEDDELGDNQISLGIFAKF